MSPAQAGEESTALLELQEARACLGQVPGQKGPDQSKVLTTDKADSSVFLGCVEAVDKDGFRLVPLKPRQQGQILGDFIKPTTTKTTTTTTTRTNNRYRALTVADLSEIDSVVNSLDIPS